MFKKEITKNLPSFDKILKYVTELPECHVVGEPDYVACYPGIDWAGHLLCMYVFIYISMNIHCSVLTVQTLGLIHVV